MKKSTVTVTSILVLPMFHGAQHFWGWVGVAVVAAVAGAFLFVAWAFYWRQMRKLRDGMRGVSEEDRKRVISAAIFDAEDRRDLETLERQDRKISEDRIDR